MHLCLSYFCCIPVGAAYFCSRAEQSKEASFALLPASQRVFQVPRKQVGPHSPGLVALCSSLFPSGSQGGAVVGAHMGLMVPGQLWGSLRTLALPCLVPAVPTQLLLLSRGLLSCLARFSHCLLEAQILRDRRYKASSSGSGSAVLATAFLETLISRPSRYVLDVNLGLNSETKGIFPSFITCKHTQTQAQSKLH